MKISVRDALFRATRWRLTLLNVTVLCTILLLLTGFLYLVEAATTDAEINGLLAHVVQQERGEDLVQIVQRPQPVIDPPRPFSPAPLQAFFLLVDTQGRVHEGAAYVLPGLPDQGALQQVLVTSTSDLRDITLQGVHLRLVTVPVLDRTGKSVGVIQAYVSLRGRDSELERLLLVLLVGSALGIGVSALAARFLAVRALIPIQQAYDQQEQFVADASHELRAPLTLLQADVEVLKRALEPLPPSRTSAESMAGTGHMRGMEGGETLLALHSADMEVIDEMHAEIGHMNALITDLLMLASYDADMHPFTKQMVVLSPLLSSIVDRLRIQAVQAQLTLHLLPDDPDPEPLAVEGDPTALRRLFLALLHNAITYTPAGGQIWLEAKGIAGKRVAVAVRDTGCGIAATDLPHLFTRFYRADKARTRSGTTRAEPSPGGAGLGLAIAQAIVERHGGTITASSSGEGQGSTFTVVLKRIGHERTHATPPPARHESPP
jgi:two-component system, OmpR family, sensor histidine kinase CiaH